MSLGTGYEYLLRSVARGDGAVAASTALTRYYEKSGTPPGRFLGTGLAGLADGVGVPAGSEVSEEQLFWLLGMLADPVTHQPLGRAPHRPTATADDGRPARLPVAGFDLTFSVPKSVSAVWAVADAATQEAIHRAHRDAIDITLAWAENNVVFTRTGIAGSRQERVRGVVAAAFDHWDSRAGDPHLHTHVVVGNRVQTLDGRWRTLDSKTLFGYVVALSEIHEGVIQDLLTERLGYRWTERPRRHSTVPRHDIDGVPNELIEAFSSRSTDIEDAKNQLIQAFVDAHGRHPDDVEVLRLRQQATLSTRPDKQHRSLAEMTSTWRARATHYIGHNTSGWAGSLREQNDLPVLTADTFEHDMLTAAGAAALEAVGRKRATFKHANVLAEVHRQLHGARFATPTDRLTLASRITDHALSGALPLTGVDGSVASRIWTTPKILEAETRLLEASRTTGAPGVPAAETELSGVDTDSNNSEAADPKTSLGADQAAAVTAIATSGRVLDLLVGPAGSGKTASLASLRTVWERHWGAGSVIGLVPSASAADVLGTELGISADNTAKWLIETRRTPDREQHIGDLEQQIAITTSSPSTARSQRLRAQLAATRAERERWTPHPGQLIIIDEAGLAGTLALDEIVTTAQAAGAKILVVGDWAQLGAVDAGGAFRMLVADRGTNTPELTTVRRFVNNWEREASLQLRNGDPACLDAYRDHDRIHTGAREQMLDALYLAWKRDTDQGLDSLMIAPDHDTATELNRRAQLSEPTDRPVVPLSDGTTARIGDRITTRRNDRTLTIGPRCWVKNGDTWTVADTTADGGIVAESPSGQRVALPAAYIRRHVELGYAITTHQAQGRTVTTAHAYVDERISRETVYVATTRGRTANQIYFATTNANRPGSENDVDEVLRHAIKRQPDNTAALTLIRESATSVPAFAGLDRAPDWDGAPFTRSTVETLQTPVFQRGARRL